MVSSDTHTKVEPVFRDKESPKEFNKVPSEKIASQQQAGSNEATYSNGLRMLSANGLDSLDEFFQGEMPRTTPH